MTEVHEFINCFCSEVVPALEHFPLYRDTRISRYGFVDTGFLLISIAVSELDPNATQAMIDMVDRFIHKFSPSFPLELLTLTCFVPDSFVDTGAIAPEGA